MSEKDKKTIGDALYMPRADEIEFEAPRLGSSGAAATEFEIDRLRQQLSEARGKIEELESALSDECTDTYGIGYKEAYQGLREISSAKDARIAELESLAIQQDKRIDELMTAEGLAQAALDQVNDIAELTLARGDYQYGLGQIMGIAASALKGTEDA